MQQVMTIQEQVYQFLKEDICSGVFRPGQRLQEVSIANQYKVSRSPVREALRRLAADGLVEEVPNKGVTVKRYSARDMEEIYEMRVMMENEAIDHLTRAKLAPMEEELTSLLARMKLAYQRRDMPDYITMDSQLHRMLVRGSGNALLFQLYDRIDTLIRQFRRFSLVDPVRQADSVVEHETILQMLLQGNNDAAKEENKRHFLLARDQVVAYLNSLPEE